MDTNKLNYRLQDIHFYLCVILVVTLPFFTVLNSFIIILLALNFILTVFTNKNKLVISKDSYYNITIFSSLFLIYCLFFIIQFKSENWFILEKKFSLLIFPILFGSGVNRLDKKRIDMLLSTFVIATFLAAIYTFIGHIDLLFGQNMEAEKWLVMDRPYFGLYASFSIFIIFYLLREKRNLLTNTIYLIIVVCFIYFMYLILAKMALVAFAIAATFTMLFYWIRKTDKGDQVGLFVFPFIGILIVGVIAVFVKAPHLFKDVFGIKMNSQEYNINVVASSEIRQMIWKCVGEIVAKDYNWIIGVGLGRSRELLDQCYLNHYSYHTWFLAQHFNAHNEFLETTLDLGLIGFTLICLMLLFSLRIAIRRSDYLYFSLIILFFVCCLTESMLTRQKGIVFYAFFNSFLGFQLRK